MKAIWSAEKQEYISEDELATYDKAGFENTPHPNFDEDDAILFEGGPIDGQLFL